jgi:hypothetical protein
MNNQDLQASLARVRRKEQHQQRSSTGCCRPISRRLKRPLATSRWPLR